MLTKTVSSPLSSFLQCWQASCKAGNVGSLCKDCLLCPGYKHFCVLFSLNLSRASPHTRVVHPQLSVNLMHFTFSCPSLALFSLVPLLKVVLSSDLPGIRWNSTGLVCYVPLNLILISLLLLPYLSVIPISPESYPEITSQEIVFFSAHSWFLLSPGLIQLMILKWFAC